MAAATAPRDRTPPRLPLLRRVPGVRLARAAAELAGLALADAALWMIWRPAGLLALGLLLVAGAHLWEP